MTERDLLDFCERHGLSVAARNDLTRLFYAGETLAEGLEEEPPEEAAAEPATLTDRYEDAGELGMGGMGEVRRMRDRKLKRTVAMKLLRPHLVGKAGAEARFLMEAQLTAQLQHPCVVPVHELGEDGDGRPFFTMTEIRGESLSEVIAELHAPARAGQRRHWTLHRLMSVFQRVCESLAFAHERGVVHRDLKPDNIILGSHGLVQVLDWGLAHFHDPAASGRFRIRSSGDSEPGGVYGTPSYMAPEQARGEGEALGPWTDIYALGATLYEILSGRPPYAARSAMLTVVKVVMGELPPLLPEDPDALAGSRSSLYTPEGGLPIPVELAAVCERAMAREPEDRHASAEDLAEDIQAWLEGSRRRQRARDLTAEAFVLEAQVEGLRNTAREFQDEADDLLSATNPWEPEDRKQAGWALEDRARSARRMARFRELEVEHKLDVALWHADLPEVHENLARLFQQRHQAAEAAGEDTRRSELRIRQHAEALPRSQRGPFLDYLEGAGLLTLETDRPVQAKLFRYRKQRRRLVPVFERDLGTTPLQRVRLDRGSYLLLLGEVPYPVLIRRGEHWDRVPPGEQAAQAIVVSECLGSDECVVPAGWFLSGDPTGTALPPRRLWCDRFVIQRQPVTNAEYLVFLNDLVASGREADALRWVPRDRGGAMDGSDGVMFYGRSPHGFFELVPDGDGDQWEPDYPVLAVDLASAMAYAAWLRQRTGQPWRLPSELEWEKAARGVDGRQHPWGDFFDPSWACGLQSRELRPLPAHVHEFPTDESPYGVRGLQGNARDWCRDVHRDEGPSVEGDRVRVPAPHPLGPNTLGVQRGGSWSDRSSGSLAWRIQANHRKRYTNTSFRLVR